MPGLSRKDSQAVDRHATEALGIPSASLMENAGAGAARLAADLLAGPGSRVVCLCGPGNNGGDALVVARHLVLAGHHPAIVRVPPSGGGDPPGDAGIQLAVCRAMRIPECVVTTRDEAHAALAGETDLVVDGLFGTGLARALRGAASDLVRTLATLDMPILALDLPSGMDCDTGGPLGACVRATLTATFVAPKLGFDDPASREWTGAVHVVGIGAPLLP